MNGKKIAGRLLRGGIAAGVGYCLFVLAADWFARTRFGTTIDGDWFLLIVASGADELRTFWSMYWKGLVSTVAGFAAVWAVATCAIWRWPKWALGIIAAGAVYLAIGGLSRISSFKPIYFAWDTVQRFGEYTRLASVVQSERELPRPPLAESGRNRLVIIGESLTSRRMGVYGYSKDTTPNLARMVAEGKLVVHPERRAAHPYTARALMDMFFDSEHTKVWRDRNAGFRTVLVSAQDRWERYCGTEQLLFDACDERIYIHESEKITYDEELIPAVQQAMSGPEPWVIYIHMIGSHFDPEDRVPASFRATENDKEGQTYFITFDDYDWSVRYTDWVVSQLIALAPTADIRFTSDHGESVNTSRWRDPSDASLWLVPEIATPQN